MKSKENKSQNPQPTPGAERYEDVSQLKLML